MKITIVGGGGRMGRWFSGLLKREGFEVIITGSSGPQLQETAKRLGVLTATTIEGVAQADTIILSVPINSFESVVKDITPYVRPEQKVVDITSIKVKPVEIMHRYFKDHEVLGTHPLFGPGAKSLTGMNFVLTPTNKQEDCFAQKVRSFLEARRAHVTLMSPGDHDDMMTVILGLSHFIALVTADTLAGVTDLKKLETIGGITYKVLLTLVESVISEDPDLYAAIQTSLTKLPELENQFLKNGVSWAKIVKVKDSERFVERMNALKKTFAGVADFGLSYQDMYKLAESKRGDSII